MCDKEQRGNVAIATTIYIYIYLYIYKIKTTHFLHEDTDEKKNRIFITR